MRVLKLLCLGIIALFSGGCGAPIPDPPRPVEAGNNKMGVHLLLDDGRNHWPVEVWPEHMQYARNAVGEWGYVTQLVETDNLDVGKWQVFMNLCAEYHLTPIIRLATEFDDDCNCWLAPPQDRNGRYHGIAQDYADFLTALEWPTDQHFVIVGNEPNHGNEWGGVPNPTEYTFFLGDVASAMHRSDPEVRVMNAPLDPFAPRLSADQSPDGFEYWDMETFLQFMYDIDPDVFTYIDVWASHPYPLGPFSQPPWEYEHNLIMDGNPGYELSGINSYQYELHYLADQFDINELPVMITETGWRHAESADLNATDSAPSNLPTAELVAEYFEAAFYGVDHPELQEGWTPWMDDPRVIAVTPFAFNGDPAEWGHTNWLILDDGGHVVGTYPIYDYFASLHEGDD